jgi:hypothetical protein
MRFGVILRKVWGGSRAWAGARAQSALMSAWRTCWQQGRSALDSCGARRWLWHCPVTHRAQTDALERHWYPRPKALPARCFRVCASK